MVLRKRRLQIVQVAHDEEQPDNSEPALLVRNMRLVTEAAAKSRLFSCTFLFLLGETENSVSRQITVY